MMNIRKKLVTLAVASAVSGGAMMMATPVYALDMNVSQNNIGEVLLFPYYTVRNGYDTLFTVTNTANTTAVVKIRWREALNSREVRDFNVILSPFDHWGGVITATTDGALIRVFDKSCTSPQLPASSVAGATEVAFTNSLFAGNFKDGATEEMGRVREGYFEVVLMGQLPNTAGTKGDVTNSTNTLAFNAKHVSNVPRNCATVDNLFLPGALATLNASGGGTSAAPLPFPEPTNILKGHVTYINVVKGSAIDSEPTALENFNSGTAQLFEPGDLRPQLSDGDLLGSALSVRNGAAVSFASAAGSQNRVSDLLRATSVINEYATGSGAGTSWVLTFPTKHHYTDSYVAGTGPTAVNQPVVAGGGFSEWFYNTPAIADGKSCDNIGVTFYNREEATAVAGGTAFSPVSATGSAELCYETNVVDFNGTSIFGGAINRLGVNTAAVGTAGWAQLSFAEGPAVTAGGLPVIGFAAIVRDAASASVNFGSSTEHTFTK